MAVSPTTANNLPRKYLEAGKRYLLHLFSSGSANVTMSIYADSQARIPNSIYNGIPNHFFRTAIPVSTKTTIPVSVVINDVLSSCASCTYTFDPYRTPYVSDINPKQLRKSTKVNIVVDLSIVDDPPRMWNNLQSEDTINFYGTACYVLSRIDPGNDLKGGFTCDLSDTIDSYVPVNAISFSRSGYALKAPSSSLVGINLNISETTLVGPFISADNSISGTLVIRGYGFARNKLATVVDTPPSLEKVISIEGAPSTYNLVFINDNVPCKVKESSYEQSKCDFRIAEEDVVSVFGITVYSIKEGVGYSFKAATDGKVLLKALQQDSPAGMIVGVTLGVAAVFAAAGGFAYYHKRRKQRQQLPNDIPIANGYFVPSVNKTNSNPASNSIRFHGNGSSSVNLLAKMESSYSVNRAPATSSSQYNLSSNRGHINQQGPMSVGSPSFYGSNGQMQWNQPQIFSSISKPPSMPQLSNSNPGMPPNINSLQRVPSVPLFSATKGSQQNLQTIEGGKVDVQGIVNQWDMYAPMMADWAEQARYGAPRMSPNGPSTLTDPNGQPRKIDPRFGRLVEEISRAPGYLNELDNYAERRKTRMSERNVDATLILDNDRNALCLPGKPFYS